jgi:hypothetical protein
MQFGEGCRRIGAEARVDAGGLQDRAAGGGKPAKPGGHIQSSDRSPFFTTAGNISKCVKVIFYFREIQGRGERQKTGGIQGIAQFEKFQVRAVEDDSYIEGFFPVYAGDNADNGVFKQVLVLHAGLLL